MNAIRLTTQAVQHHVNRIISEHVAKANARLDTHQSVVATTAVA
jgi:hypothetical protein